MKKSLRLIIPVVIVIALVISTALAFTLTGGAADAEATLSTRTVTFSSTGYVNGLGTATTTEGGFAELAAGFSSLAPTEATRYYLKLNSNVTLESPITIATTELVEVIIDLGGHTLASAVEGDTITVTGGGTVRILGDFTESGENGKMIASGEGSLVRIAEGSTARVVVKHVDIDASLLTASAPLISANGGTLVVQSTNITRQPATASDATIISAENTDVEIKTSSINTAIDGQYTSTAIELVDSTLYIDKTDIDAKRAIATSGTSYVLAIDAALTADSPVSIDSSDTVVYFLGSVIKTLGSSVVNGDYSAENVVFYYGTGDTKVIGENPSAYTVQDKCSFTEADGAWVLTTTETTEVLITQASVGSAPTVKANSFNDGWKVIKASGSSKTVTEVRIVALLRDAVQSNYSTAASQYNEHTNLIIDLNGHHLQINGTGNNDVYGNPYWRYDGTGVDGTVGTMALYGANPMYVRIRCAVPTSSKPSYTYIGANEHTYYAMDDLNFVLELCNATSGISPLLAIQMGECEMSNVNFTYTGRGAENTAKRNVTFIQVGSSANPMLKGHVHFDNVTMSDTCENTNMFTYVFDPGYYTRTFIKNSSFEDIDCVVSIDGGASMYIADSTIIGNAPLTGDNKSTIKVADSSITVGSDGVLSSGGISPIFLYGTGKTEILTGDAELAGNYSPEEGYAVVFKGNGRYVLMDADNIINASVKMPAIFANGMVLQRNKPLNVYGYCDTEGATVEVTIGDKVATATVKDGRWDATFEPMDAAFGVTVEVRQTGDNVAYNLIRLTNVNIGEIWAISGQSNGNLTTRYMEDLLEFSELANSLKNVRMYKSSIGYSVTEKTIGSGTWYEGTKANVRADIMSAIGYTAAAKLAAELGEDVPVAILHLARGSSKIKTWLDYEELKALSPSATEEYEYWLGQNMLPINAHGAQAVGTVMYNNVIAPLEGYALAGVMWYQGEGDTGGQYYGATKGNSSNRISYEYYEDVDGVSTKKTGYISTTPFFVDDEGNPYEESHTYTEYFYAVEKSFRRAFGNDDELPFYVMQLSPFLSDSYTTVNTYNFKMEQYAMCEGEANTHLVSLATDGTVIEDVFFGTLDPDIGNTSVSSQGFIHPLRKSTVGIRTADMILANEYGIQFVDVYTYPKPTKVSAEGGVVTIEFDSELQIFYGDTVLGFELYDGAKWVKASGEIDGNKVILSADGVENPTEVRYGCGETLIELGDGTFIEITNDTYTSSSADKTITVTYDGVKYVIRGNTTDMIRTVDYGNITNASGVPMPIFGLVIEN